MDKEKILSFMREQAYKPLTIAELEEVFEVNTGESFKQFVRTINELEEAGEIVRTRTNRYGVPERMNLIKGKIQGNAKGFAFLLPEIPEEPDVFIAERDLNGAWHGDTVLVRINHLESGKRSEGEVIRILKRGLTQVVGTYTDRATYGFVVVDEKRITQDIFIPKEASKGAVEGHKVVVQITSFPEDRRSAEGEIIEILGHKNDPGVDILSIIRKFQMPEAFSAEVMQEAEAIPDSISEQEIRERRDLRAQTIVTIDGADAKDLDDAISLEKNEQGNFVLGVHIADVSHYVTKGSALDQEAYRRGTSVYLVDRVIPMIPHRLSNGICSLNPHEDRLTLSCEMEITPTGEVVAHQIYPSVICSTARMTYTEVRQIVEREEEEVVTKYEPLVPLFDRMKELALILRQRRMTRGAIDFDLKEAKIHVDEEGHPSDITIRERSIAEKIIEEFMLAANETVAEHFHWLHVPFLYRIHEDPKQEKLERFVEFISNFGYLVRGSVSAIHPRSLQVLLEQIKGSPEETVISTILLRSMQQAKYFPQSLGHFGLSTDFYTHFTAPIRRYPDLIVHRLIHTYLVQGDLSEETRAHWAEKLEEIAEHTSYRERQAVEAERETDDLKKAEYMQDKIGEEFEGVISGVTSFGIFVELENTVEGLVHVSYMTDDYYHYHERFYAMVGERSGKIYRLGDVVQVRVLQVNVDERSIDFEIVGSKSSGKRSNKKSLIRLPKKDEKKGLIKEEKKNPSVKKKRGVKDTSKKKRKVKKGKKL